MITVRSGYGFATVSPVRSGVCLRGQRPCRGTPRTPAPITQTVLSFRRTMDGEGEEGRTKERREKRETRPEGVRETRERPEA